MLDQRLGIERQARFCAFGIPATGLGRHGDGEPDRDRQQNDKRMMPHIDLLLASEE